MKPFRALRYDPAGNQGGGTANGLNRLAQTGPTVIFNLLQQMEALGINVPQILEQLGVKTTKPPEKPEA